MSQYQYREIGEGEGWRDCTKEAYDGYQRDPHIDTRIAPDSIDYMRRCDIQRMTDAERLITHALYAVEQIPDADVRLTDAGSLLVAARIRLADYVDGIPGIVTRPIQTHSAASYDKTNETQKA